MAHSNRRHWILTAAFTGALCSLALSNPTLTPGAWVDITPAGLTLVQFGVMTYDIEIDPNNPATLYLTTTMAANYGPIWKTTNAGSTWSNIGNFGGTTKGVGFGKIRINPNNSQHLYTISEQGAQQGFWISTDGGNNWTQPQGFVTFCQNLGMANFVELYDISVDPTDFQHILITSKQPCPTVAESKDGGASWISHPIPASTGDVDYDVFFLYNPALGIGDSKTWACSPFYGSMYRTTDAGTTWTVVLPNSNSAQGAFHKRIYYTKSTGVLYMGNQPNPIRSTDNGVTWQPLNSSGINGSGYDFVVMGDGNYLYTGHSNIWGYISGKIVVSPESDGLTWTPYNGGAQTLTNGPMDMAFDSVNRIMYSSNLYGLLALKVLGSTNIAPGRPARSIAAQSFSARPASLGVGEHGIVLNRAAGTFNARGVLVGHANAGSEGTTSISTRQRIGAF